MTNKQLRLFVVTLLALTVSSTLYLSCRKGVGSAQTNASLILEAQTYFNNQVLPTHNPDAFTGQADFRKSLHKTPDWSKAIVEQLAYGPTVTVPLKIKEPLHLIRNGKNISIDGLSFLLLYRDSTHQYHAEVITKIPTDTFLQTDPAKRIFSGIVTVEDWAGNPIKEYRYTPQGVPTKAQSMKAITPSPSGSNTLNAVKQPNTIPKQPLADCYETDWWACIVNADGSTDNCIIIDGAEICFPVDDDPTPDPWFYEYAGSGVIGTTSSLTYAQLENDFMVAAPEKGISKTAFPQYIKCFDAAGSAYTVSLYVDQPDPGSSATFVFNGSDIDVGHTFLVFNETGGANGDIQRSMGFYPSSFAKPTSTNAPGILGDNSGHAANIEVTFTLTSAQFRDILNYMSQAYNQDYNLDFNNCTSFALNALSAGGITINTQIGFWPGGSGYNPGNLGQTLLVNSSPYGSNWPGNLVTRTMNMGNGPDNFGCGY